MTSYAHRCDICGHLETEEHCALCHQAHDDLQAQRGEEMNTEAVNQ